MPSTINQQQPSLSHSLFDWLNYLGSLHVSAIDMGLSRVLPVAEALGVLPTAQKGEKPQVFTVAGTNGKGSTTASISAITEKAGYKTALYQSPHIVRFNERIQINNEAVADESLIKAFKQVDDARIRLNLSLSFFEATTLAAFLLFKQENCDVWVLEIGLGGRLDVVNIIDPNVAVITNIGVDHVDWLGDDVEKIGYEKAGILRKNIPCVLANSIMPTSVWKKTTELNNRVYAVTADYTFTEPQELAEKWVYSNKAVTMVLPMPSLALENVAAAISAVLASRLTVQQTHIDNALVSLNLMGRFYQQVISIDNKSVLAIFDALHNPDGARFLLKKLAPLLVSNKVKTLHIVFSMLADKDIAGVINLLQSTLSSLKIDLIWHIAPLSVARAIQLEDLKSHFEQVSISEDAINSYKNIQNATIGAYQSAHESDNILVCGSFHTIADALSVLDA